MSVSIPTIPVPSCREDGSWIYKDGKRIHRSKNLRGLLDYARRPCIYVERVLILRLPDGEAAFYVYYSDGAVGTSQFLDHTVAKDWAEIRIRHSYAWGSAELEVIDFPLAHVTWHVL